MEGKKPQGKNMMACPILYGGHNYVLAFRALTLLAGHQEEHPVCKN